MKTIVIPLWLTACLDSSPAPSDALGISACVAGQVDVNGTCRVLCSRTGPVCTVDGDWWFTYPTPSGEVCYCAPAPGSGTR
jgi:hypothetical protein